MYPWQPALGTKTYPGLPRYTGLTDFRVTLRGPGRKFSIRRTQLRPKGKFFLPSGESVMADMMMQEAELALVS